MKAIIFDFDGVIADTYNLYLELAREVGHDVSHEDFKAHHDGNVYEKPVIPFTKESQEIFFSKCFEKITDIKPFLSKGHIEDLSKGKELYILSSGKEYSIEKFLEHYDLKNYFSEILGQQFHKSKIEKFKYIFNKYKYTPDDVVFISDTLGDILEAHKVGVRTIAVDFGFHERERLERGKPHVIVSNFEELKAEIEKL